MHPNILKDIIALNEKYKLGCESTNSVKFITDNPINIKKFLNKFNWDTSSYYPDLSEEFIETYAHRIGWMMISSWFALSEEFLDKYQDKIHWRHLGNVDKLSEEFIEKHVDQVSWSTLARCGNFSESFIMKHISKFGVKTVLQYQSRNLSEKLINRLNRRLKFQNEKKLQKMRKL